MICFCLSFGRTLDGFRSFRMLSGVSRMCLASFGQTFGFLWLLLGFPWAPIGHSFGSLQPAWGTGGSRRFRGSSRSCGKGGRKCCLEPYLHRAGRQDEVSFTKSLTQQFKISEISTLRKYAKIIPTGIISNHLERPNCHRMHKFGF